MLRHVVLIQLENPTEEHIAETARRLRAMEGQIPELLAIEVGTDILRSERSYEICLITTFESLEAMQAYQVHPVHKDVIAYLATVRKASVCSDYLI
jgi:hypothetical protein